MTLHELSPDSEFLQTLRAFDFNLFQAMKRKGCPRCGGQLDTSNYLRKTRGLSSESEICFSLCCRREGCRKRSKPQSVRFLGQRVYGAWVVILAVDYCRELGLSGQIARQTISRWREFWRMHLSSGGAFVKWARGFLPPGCGFTESPSSFFHHFNFPLRESWFSILSFFTIQR